LLVDGKPEWWHQCENCLACYNFCPEGAIESQIAQHGYRYIHPQYKAKTAIESATRESDR
jgi:MinD superfamily P-loop ATPase